MIRFFEAEKWWDDQTRNNGVKLQPDEKVRGFEDLNLKGSLRLLICDRHLVYFLLMYII